MFGRILAAGLMLAAVSAAPAAAGTMENSYGNTFVTTDTTGLATKWYFDADGTFKGVGSNGVAFGGTWTVEGQRLCISMTPLQGQTPPPPSCGPHVEDKNVGDTWEATNDAGLKFTVTLTEGR